MADDKKKIEFKIDNLEFGESFFKASNLEKFKEAIKNAEGVDKGAFKIFSENVLTNIDFYLEESNPNDISRRHLLNGIVQICQGYENAPKKKSKKVAKVMAKLRESLLNPPSSKIADKNIK